MLADPAWRARARDSWDNQFAHSYLHEPAANLLRESESGYGPIGVTLADYMAQAGIAHASDALAEWVLNNGQESVVLKESWAKDEAILNKLLVDTHSLANVSDAGAHGKLFCGAGYNVFLLTDYVRDRKVLSLEQGVHMLTGRLSGFFGHVPSAALRASVTVGPAKPGMHDHTYAVAPGVGTEGETAALGKEGSGGCESAATSAAVSERL